MAERKIAVVPVLFLVILMVVVALVPVANADACNDECYKGCEKDAKKNDVHSCTITCDDMCHLKAKSQLYAAASPDEKAAVAKTFEKEAADAISEDAAAPTPGFATLDSGCLRECKNNLCHGGKDNPACTTRCDNVCREEVEGLAFAGKTYAQSPAADNKAIIEAIDKQAGGPHDNVETLADICISDCTKLCEKDPACVAICENGCRGRSVNLAFTLSTSTEKESIKKDIEAAAAAATATASKLVGAV
jgi:hypothetical protein